MNNYNKGVANYRVAQATVLKALMVGDLVGLIHGDNKGFVLNSKQGEVNRERVRTLLLI